jgi:hypothetical protein
MRFTPDTTEMFNGGDFDLGRPRTLGELRAALQVMEKEMSTWGDDNTKIAEIHLDQKCQLIRVLLDEGIPQP